MHHEKIVAILGLLATITTGQVLDIGEKLYQPDGSFLVIAGYAKRVIHDNGFSGLKRQVDQVGSWSLRALTCPSDTQTCESSPVSGNACCTKGSTCVSWIYRVACCPTSDRCDQTAETFPRCADPSWKLWQGGYDIYFCCLQDQKGYITVKGGGACGPESLNPTGSQVATAVNNESPPPTANPDGSSSSKSSTIPPSSTTDSTSGNGDSSISTKVTTESTSGSEDSPSSTQGSSGGSQTGSTNTPVSIQGNSNTANDTSSNSASSGLSTGAIIGIAVGGIGVLLLAIIGIFLARSSGKKKGQAQAMAAFQSQNQVESRSPGGNIFPSTGSSTPFQPPPPPPPPPIVFGQDNQSKGAVGEFGPDHPQSPPPQWNPGEGNTRYEADGTHHYQSANFAEMPVEANGRRTQ